MQCNAPGYFYTASLSHYRMDTPSLYQPHTISHIYPGTAHRTHSRASQPYTVHLHRGRR